MEAKDLQSGFRLGDWLIEPRQLHATRGGVTIVVPEQHMRVLLCLVESQGVFVDRHTLRGCAYANAPDGDKQLRAAIVAWHRVFGDSAQHPRYIAANGQDGYSLVARLESATPLPIPERLMAAGIRNVSTTGNLQTLVGHASRLLGELRRRRVFRVTASYLIGMWILLQVAEVTFAPLHFPSWWITVMTILAVMGVPIIIVLAWTYEITPGGVMRDAADVAAAHRFPNSHRAVAPAIIVGVIFMASATGYAWWESIQ
jgi:DNA-binding winged helix-turn-helix (wHTH) protein